MDEMNRNARTLIVSFVLAVMVLIPLRFVEVGQTVSDNQSRVLGETIVGQTAVVPETATPTVGLEEPYKTIENQKNCVIKADIDAAWKDLRTEVESKQINQDQVTEMVANLMAAEQNSCK